MDEEFLIEDENDNTNKGSRRNRRSIYNVEQTKLKRHLKQKQKIE